MKARRAAMILSLSMMTTLLILVLGQRIGRGADLAAQSIDLIDGERVEGILLRIEEGSYVVQTADKCLIVGPQDVIRVAGDADWSRQVPQSDLVVRNFETYEVITPDGDLELHSKIERRNAGTKVIQRIDWGLAPHEYPKLAHYEVVDAFGNHLPYGVEDDPKNNRKKVTVELPRPVLPGETLRLTTIVLEEDRIHDDNGTLVYRHRGDYPDDRLVTRSVCLPEGAQIVSVDPEPLQILETGGRKLVVWRRYFRKGEVSPWEIRYTR